MKNVTARRLWFWMVTERGMARPRIEIIQRTVAQYYGTSFEEMGGRTRAINVAKARHIAWYVIRRVTGYSYPRISKLVDRDHSTVMHGVMRICRAMQFDPVLKKRINQLEAECRRVCDGPDVLREAA